MYQPYVQKMPLLQETTIDKLHVKLAQNRLELGQYAAKMAAINSKSLLQSQETVNIMFAAAPSQNE